MSLALALDTTGEFGSIALARAEGAKNHVLEQLALHSPEGFGHLLFGEISALLARHATKLSDIDVFASASGPGSFTGVRVGLAAVKGLAEATGRKVVAVSNLQALAWFGSRALRATIIDARRGEIYGAVHDAQLRAVCDEVVMPLPAWLASMPEGDLEFVTAGYPLAGLVEQPVVEAPRELAGVIAQIALNRFAAGAAQDPAEVDANYVRRSDAELLWRDVT